MEAKSIPKREDASLLGSGLTGRSVTPRKVGPIRNTVMKETASLRCLGTYSTPVNDAL